MFSFKQPSYEKAESYWWYRLVKTLYILFVLAVLTVTLSDGTIERPKTDYYESKYGVSCENGNSFGRIEGSNISYNWDLSLEEQDFKFKETDMTTIGKVICSLETDPTDEERAEIIKGVILNDGYQEYLFKPVNFTIEVREEAFSPTWNEFYKSIGWLVFALIIAIIVIPLLFRYILFGKLRIKEDFTVEHHQD